MALDLKVLEIDFPDFEILVERGKIREYVSVLGLEDPVHYDVQAA